MGPKKIMHTFITWELLSKLHRTSVIQGYLAGWQERFCVIQPPPQAYGTFCECANYTLIV